MQILLFEGNFRLPCGWSQESWELGFRDRPSISESQSLNLLNGTPLERSLLFTGKPMRECTESLNWRVRFTGQRREGRLGVRLSLGEEGPLGAPCPGGGAASEGCAEGVKEVGLFSPNRRVSSGSRGLGRERKQESSQGCAAAGAEGPGIDRALWMDPVCQEGSVRGRRGARRGAGVRV